MVWFILFVTRKITVLRVLDIQTQHLMKHTKNTGLKEKYTQHVEKISLCSPDVHFWALLFWRSSQYLFTVVFLLTTKQICLWGYILLDSVPICFTFWVGPFELRPAVSLLTSTYIFWGGIERGGNAISGPLERCLCFIYYLSQQALPLFSTAVVICTSRDETSRKVNKSYRS